MATDLGQMCPNCRTLMSVGKLDNYDAEVKDGERRFALVVICLMDETKERVEKLLFQLKGLQLKVYRIQRSSSYFALEVLVSGDILPALNEGDQYPRYRPQWDELGRMVALEERR
jgi:hypothetical protein